jgi:hypothetical protein
MWEVPNLENLLPEDVGTISGNRKLYYEKRDLYHSFADDLLARIEAVEG